MQTNPYDKPHPATLTRGRPSRASATRPTLLGAVVQVPRLPPLHLAPVTDDASRRPQVRGQRPPTRPDGPLRPDVGGGLPRGVIATLWYEKVSPGASLPAAPNATPSLRSRGSQI